MPQPDIPSSRSRARARPARRRNPRRWLTAGALLTLIALGIVLVSGFATANPHLKLARAPDAAPSIPHSRQRLPYGAAVRGSCAAVDHAATNEMRGWGVYTFDPARSPVTDAAGRRLLPASFAGATRPPGLDAFASGTTRPDDPGQWQVASGSRQMPAAPGASCQNSIAVVWPDAVRSGTAIRLRRPGPYVYWTLDHTVHWVKVSNATADPIARPCAQGVAPHATSPAPAGEAPSDGGQNWHWAVDSFCTKVRWWTFDVLGSPGRCPLTTDGSLWPSVSYMNQYAAGARLRLPLGRGEAGGNACGPSALMMAMLQSESRRRHGHGLSSARAAALPALKNVFDQTMQHRRARVKANAANEFVGTKAADFLARHGWPHATLDRLGTSAESIGPETSGSDLDPSNEATLDHALKHGPVLISTDLGTERWGATGDGHMIVVLGRARDNPGEYVVYDPAGNYFASPTRHYRASSCGAAVLYPQSWVYAYTTGAWYIELGAPKA